MQYYEINEQTARRANDVNSMSDYRPGSATEEYRAAVDKAAALVQARKAKISPYYHDKLDALLDRYARRLADYYNAYYRNESACPSILVCGGSNFPVRKKQKQNARRESLWQEYKEIDAILDKIRSVGTGAVDLTDPHARELLQDRLQQEQNALDYCKAANAYYRKHKTLRGYASLTDQQADALTDPDAFSVKLYGKPYGDFELSSLRGKIKRIQARLADLDKLQAAAQQPDNTTKFDGGRTGRSKEERTMENPITRAEHEEFRRRLEEENKRQDARIGILEDSVRQIGALATSVEKLAVSMQSMLKEQEKQGKRLEALEGRDGEKWRKVMGYIATAIVGVVLGYLFKQIGM